MTTYILVAFILILAAVNVYCVNYFYNRLQHQKMLYETVSTWNEHLAKQIADYESRMDPNLFTFKYPERKLVGIRGEYYSCYFLGSSDDGKQLKKEIDFKIKLRHELPIPIWEAEEIKK